MKNRDNYTNLVIKDSYKELFYKIIIGSYLNNSFLRL